MVRGKTRHKSRRGTACADSRLGSALVNEFDAACRKPSLLKHAALGTIFYFQQPGDNIPLVPARRATLAWQHFKSRLGSRVLLPPSP